MFYRKGEKIGSNNVLTEINFVKLFVLLCVIGQRDLSYFVLG